MRLFQTEAGMNWPDLGQSILPATFAFAHSGAKVPSQLLLYNSIVELLRKTYELLSAGEVDLETELIQFSSLSSNSSSDTSSPPVDFEPVPAWVGARRFLKINLVFGLPRLKVCLGARM